MTKELVAFLDFDGVISSPRAYNANWEMKNRDTRWIDPIACKLIKRLQEAYEFTLVISSTWRSFGLERCSAVLNPYGLDECLHQDWKTNHWPDGSRPQELDDWLSRNDNPEYIIFDDDAFAWTSEQRLRWIQSDCYNGFTLDNYTQAENMLTRMTGKSIVRC